MDPTTTDLSAFHIPGTSKAYYVPDFVTVEEEAYLIRKVRVQAVSKDDSGVKKIDI
jgi:hypothetical protein